MLARSKALIVGLIAACAAMAVPVNATAALAPCQGRSVASVLGNQYVLVTGEYVTTSGYDVELTCGIVRQGYLVASFTDPAFGPAAALADKVTVLGDFTTCWRAVVRYLEHSTSDGNCP